ncbi:MAG: YigZ family protein [Thermoanaerobaculia bacterium]|nr:YigZ family protein [Thermoanaerobaculia bacterium]
MPWVRTLARRHSVEIDKIKGSRFLATASPVSSISAAEAFLVELKDEYRDATHNCWAYRLESEPDSLRYSDDGEPSGTAGQPILREIVGRSLLDVALVVTRYYGGTKLGTGGLMRAYSAAAAVALAEAPVVERRIAEVLRIRFEYGFTGSVQSVLAAHGLKPERADYGADVAFDLEVPTEDVEAVRRQLVDATTGSIVFQ